MKLQFSIQQVQKILLFIGRIEIAGTLLKSHSAYCFEKKRDVMVSSHHLVCANSAVCYD